MSVFYARRSVGKVVDIADGRRFRLSGDLIDARLAFYGEYEPELTTVWRSILRRGDVAVDVGANFGWYSTLFARLVGEPGQVHAFEPNPDVLHALRSNLELNGATSVKVHEMALGAADGEVAIHAPPGQLGRGVTVLAEDLDGADRTTPMIALDSMALKRLDALKIDVEGHELPVLLGALETLRRCRPVLQVELADSESRRSGEEVVALLRGLGYRLLHHPEWRHDAIAVHPQDQRFDRLGNGDGLQPLAP